MSEKFDENNLELKKYEKEYSESGLWDKIKSVAKKAGEEIIYNVLLLYYALQSDNVTKSDKAKIIAALGYFILPIDLIPDAIPALGFTDDASLLVYLIRTLICIDADVKANAKARLAEWFD